MSTPDEAVPLLRHHATRRGRKTQKSDAWRSTSKAELFIRACWQAVGTRIACGCLGCLAGQGRSALSVQGNPGRISCHPPLVGVV